MVQFEPKSATMMRSFLFPAPTHQAWITLSDGFLFIAVTHIATFRKPELLRLCLCEYIIHADKHHSASYDNAVVSISQYWCETSLHRILRLGRTNTHTSQMKAANWMVTILLAHIVTTKPFLLSWQADKCEIGLFLASHGPWAYAWLGRHWKSESNEWMAWDPPS